MDAFTRLNQQQFEAAKRRVRELQASLPRAVAAYFDPRLQQVVIQLSSLVEIRFSPDDAEGLQGATSADLNGIEITDSGFGIHFPNLDVDLSVPAMLLGRLGSESWMARRRSAPAERSRSTKKKQGNTSTRKPILLETKNGRRPAWHGLRPIDGGLAASRTPERTQSKVEKYQDHDGGDHKYSVIRTMGPAHPHAPKTGSERDYWQKKESARDLEPQNASDSAKWPQESAEATSDACAGLTSQANSLPRILRMNSRVDNGLRPGRRSGVRIFCKPLSHHATRDTYADSQDASNRLWSHPIYDGSSDSA